MLQKNVVDSTGLLLIKQNTLLKNIQKSVKIQNKLVLSQRETIKQTLGDGYPTVVIVPENDNNISFAVTPSGNYSIYDANIRVVNSNKLRKMKIRRENNKNFLSVDSIRTCIVEFNKQPLSPKMFSRIDYKVLTSESPKFLVFEISARNISTIQYSIIYKDKNKLNHAYKIFKVQNRKYDLLIETTDVFINKKIWEDNFYFKENECYLEYK
ncbi:hypothetical protein [Flavobacterium sp.]|uniref:hypothetical protein n=1 Tax=Flavobacterium sp. TaxID=239 RepID=UPI00286CFDCE|nr:hypothetical protein [Flavobacterium sp.]